MKKSDFWIGFLMLLASVLCLVTALRWAAPLGSLFCGFSGALGVSGLVQLYKYFKWTSPKHAAAYREHLEQEQIDLRDERKEMLRDKAGRYAYILGLLIAVAALLAFSVLEMLGAIPADTGRLLVIVLAAYTLFQYAAGIVIYRVLSRKY